MIRALGSRLYELLPEKEDSLPIMILGLEACLVATFLFGLSKTVIGFEAGAFVFPAFLAVLMPRIAALRKVRTWSAVSTMFAVGISAVLVSALRMWGLVARLCLNFVSSGFYLAEDGRIARFTDQIDLYSRISYRFDLFWNNLQVWFQYLVRGESIQVSQAIQVIWGIAAFVILLWLGWHLHLRKQPFLAVIPAIVVLGINSELTNYPLHFFGIVFALALFIVVVFSHHEREKSWRSSAIGYSLDIRLDLWGVAALFCVAAFLISVFPPELSIRRMLEEMEIIGDQQEGSPDFTSGLGLAALYPDPDGSGAAGRMPSSHLISSPPEQLDTHLFDVWIGDLDPGFSPNWRTHTFQTYTGHGWLVGDSYPRRYDAEEPVSSDFSIPQVTRYITVWARSESLGKELIHAYQLVTVDQPFEVLWRDGSSNRPDYSFGLIDAPLYVVQVSQPAITINTLRSAGFDYPEWIISRYLQLPEDLSAEVVELGAGFSQLYADPYSRAKAIESYFRQFPYNMDVPTPPADQDVVAYFLFDLKQGYCDYFATSMAVLARSAGLPARVVGGYSSGEYLKEDGLFRVTAADAHTWVEIYFAGIGWVEFEPTSARPLVTHDLQSGAENEVIYPQAGWDIPAAPAISDNQVLLLWVGGLVLVLVVGFILWQRIRYLPLSRAELLIQARDRLYQISAMFGTFSPQTLTPGENSASIRSGISPMHSQRWSRHLAEKWQVAVDSLVEKLEQAAYGGVMPEKMEKASLVADLVRIGRMTWWIRMTKMWQKRSLE